MAEIRSAHAQINRRGENLFRPNARLCVRWEERRTYRHETNYFKKKIEQNDLAEMANVIECLGLFQAKSKNHPLSLLLSIMFYSF